MASDQYFRNLVDYRLEVLETAEIPTTDLILADVDRLIEALDRELGD